MGKLTEETIKARIVSHSKRFSRLLKMDFLEIEIKFRRGIKSYYGVSDGPKRTIIFNKDYIESEEPSILFDYVIGHEVCHQYTDWRGGEYNESYEEHCDRWEQNMVRAGLPPLISFLNEKDLEKYVVKIDQNWKNYSIKKLSASNTILVKYRMHEEK